LPEKRDIPLLAPDGTAKTLMDRLQKKCAIASTGMHLLLLVILMVGPAFFTSKQTAPDLAVIDFVPFKTVDALVTGGGNPNATPPAAPPQAPPQQPQPQPQPAPPKPAPAPKIQEPAPAKETMPPKETPRPAVKDSDSLEASEKPRKEFNFVPKNRDNFNKAKETSEADKRQKQLGESRKFAAQQVAKAAAALGNSLSSGTSVELKGPGGGGLPYASFLQAVMNAYDRAWHLPAGVADNDAATLVSVTIARDGTVVSARIIQHSGNKEVDRSVQSAIDRVTYAAPLPEDSRESQRTVEINFNVKAKRLAG
jgi:TonB family protein